MSLRFDAAFWDESLVPKGLFTITLKFNNMVCRNIACG